MVSHSPFTVPATITRPQVSRKTALASFLTSRLEVVSEFGTAAALFSGERLPPPTFLAFRGVMGPRLSLATARRTLPCRKFTLIPNVNDGSFSDPQLIAGNLILKEDLFAVFTVYKSEMFAVDDLPTELLASVNF